ncbi:MAG: hypothetical protein WC653_04980, partial [Candidatus Gracilibacteria bacterium]
NGKNWCLFRGLYRHPPTFTNVNFETSVLARGQGNMVILILHNLTCKFLGRNPNLLKSIFEWQGVFFSGIGKT